MSFRQVAIVAVLVAAGVGLLAAPTLGFGFAAEDEGDEEIDGLGTEVGTFAQSTAESANASVDRGMWAVAINQTDRPGEGVTERAAVLEQRLDRLEAAIAALEAERDAGNISKQAYQARAAALETRLANLERSLEQAARAGERAGVNTTQIETLRTNAANMTGPEIAATARNITEAPRAPPDDTAPGNETDAGPPDDAGPDNETDAGSSDDDDTGPDTDTDAGPSEDSGPGGDNETGPPENQGTGFP